MKLITIIVGILFSGAGIYSAKVVGDTLWVPIQAYQQEKLYDLEDDRDEYLDRELLGEELTPLDDLNFKRLLKRIERLEDQIE